MPDNPTVWIVIAAVIALVFIVAMMKKGRRKLSVKGPGGIGANLEETGRTVTVGKKLQAENAELGNVIGSRSTAGSTASEIDVLNEANLKGTKTGDVIGEVITPATEPPKKTE
jgi:hypothetical protein